jgi:hypothetical protein
MHRGWTLLLSLYLLAWVPLNYAVELLGVLPSLGVRGLPALVEIGVHGAAAAVSAAAGWMLWVRSPAAFSFAAVAVAANGIAAIQSLYWSALPRQTAPGERLPLAMLTLAVTAFWLLFLRLGRR